MDVKDPSFILQDGLLYVLELSPDLNPVLNTD